jgi:toxin-antitoxin system PIN domain toxin
MRLVDLNVLLYAVNRNVPKHEAARRWWEGAISGAEPVGVSWHVLLGFLRLSTGARGMAAPLAVGDALAQVEEWVSHPNVHILLETPEHWRILQELLREVGTAGDLASDAHLAALAISHGATLVSCDSDFGRFRRLRWENPLA